MDKFIRRVEVEEVQDGDTITVAIDLGFKSWLHDQRCRLYGVNAFETTRRGSWDDGLTEEEVDHRIGLGKKAALELELRARSAHTCWIESKVSPEEIARKGKYGRWLVVLWIQDEPDKEPYSWNEWLIENEFGYRYMED